MVVADEYIMAVPLVHSEIGVEAVCDGVPRKRALSSVEIALVMRPTRSSVRAVKPTHCRSFLCVYTLLNSAPQKNSCAE
jgi:hypothetical protein